MTCTVKFEKDFDIMVKISPTPGYISVSHLELLGSNNIQEDMNVHLHYGPWFREGRVVFIQERFIWKPNSVL